jgi:hypothetical protein
VTDGLIARDACSWSTKKLLVEAETVTSAQAIDQRFVRELGMALLNDGDLPGGGLMETLWKTALWRQFGAAIDMLDRAVVACPPSLWTQRLWRDPPPPPLPPQFGEFWYVAFHALVWLDLYLGGGPEEDFAPPAPFAHGELDSIEALPAQPYTREEVRAYLVSLRQTCHATLVGLTDDQAHRPVAYPWLAGQPINFLELQLYNLRHVQEHAAQLSLFLGQHAIPDAGLAWIPRAKE